MLDCLIDNDIYGRQILVREQPPHADTIIFYFHSLENHKTIMVDVCSTEQAIIFVCVLYVPQKNTKDKFYLYTLRQKTKYCDLNQNKYIESLVEKEKTELKIEQHNYIPFPGGSANAEIEKEDDRYIKPLVLIKKQLCKKFGWGS